MTTLLACELRADEALQPREKQVILGFHDAEQLRPIWGTVQNIVHREGEGQRETRFVDLDLLAAVRDAVATDLDRFLAGMASGPLSGPEAA